MTFMVYDSLTGKKQPLLSQGQTTLGMYVCGPTVYQRIHIGNARPFIVFMCLQRYLRHLGIDVKFVSNITDINDKIYTAATAQGMGSEELAAQATQWYLDDTSDLGLGRPDIEPKASETVAEQIALINDLIAADLAYESGGDVYFRVEAWRDYGKLSGQQVEQMIEGARVEPGEHKERPLDFALWKATKGDEDTSWDSPWGKGRPGWHIECSAMAEKYLGESFDVHGGGLDLIFPHHENERAQSCGAGRGFARVWMHNGLLELKGEKMSKSVGNIMSLREVLDRWPAWAVVLFFLSGSYRNPIDFSPEALDEAVTRGQRLTEAMRRAERYLATVQTRMTGDPEFADSTDGWDGIHENLQDDFNTAGALSELAGIQWELNTGVRDRATPQFIRNRLATMREFCEVFGLEKLIPATINVPANIVAMVEKREAARAAKDFEKSDELRDALKELGWVVRDTDDGTDLIPLDEASAVGAASA